MAKGLFSTILQAATAGQPAFGPPPVNNPPSEAKQQFFHSKKEFREYLKKNPLPVPEEEDPIGFVRPKGPRLPLMSMALEDMFRGYR